MAVESKVKTIGVLTSGGDAPGMNAAIRAAVRRGLSRGIKMKGILKGYDGLMNEEIIDLSAQGCVRYHPEGRHHFVYSSLRGDAYRGRSAAGGGYLP